METSHIKVVPHPHFLEALFAFRSKISRIFGDVLGMYDISHIAVTQINPKQQILSFSSTPAMEFNLFNSNLWRFDKTYHPDWFQNCSQTDWRSLYFFERYDELYYLKQIKHHYPLGYSLATKLRDNFYVYSIASHRSCQEIQDVFANQHDDFYKIGQYCNNSLTKLFENYDC